jgi:hypothetical protein
LNQEQKTNQKTERKIKMKTSKRTPVLFIAAVLISMALAACNNNPVNESSNVSSGNDLAELLTVRDGGKRVLNLDKFMMPGENWIISIKDFGLEKVDGLVSVSVDAEDPRVPPYQTTGNCSDIGILVEDNHSSAVSDCRADGFWSNSLVLVNTSKSPLLVTAVVIGMSKSKYVPDEW